MGPWGSGRTLLFLFSLLLLLLLLLSVVRWCLWCCEYLMFCRVDFSGWLTTRKSQTSRGLVGEEFCSTHRDIICRRKQSCTIWSATERSFVVLTLLNAVLTFEDDDFVDEHLEISSYGKISNDHMSVTGHPVYFMFGSRLRFSGMADRLALLPVRLSSVTACAEWRYVYFYIYCMKVIFVFC